MPRIKSACLLLVLVACQQTPNTLDSTPLALPLEPLYTLPHYGDSTLEKGFQQRYSLLIYLNELSCSSCINREMLAVGQFYKQVADQLDFLLVIHLGRPLTENAYHLCCTI